MFSIAGDSFGASFRTAEEALATALRIQRALANEPWEGPPIRVRMGIHTGSGEEREGNYFGSDVNRAARVMDAANGGQVLVSAVTAELLAGRLDASTSLVDRGLHPLKGLERPEHLFEARHPDVPEVTEPLRTVQVDRIHLPAQLTTFVGRQGELAAVLETAERSRLVTLTGAGGTGKTRLAMEAAGRMAERFSDGVWMAELAPLTEGSLVAAEVADTLGLGRSEEVDLVRLISSYLENRELLLVIDNCEHLVADAASLVSELLASSSGLTVLATSRESLGVAGEVVYRVPSLGLVGATGAEADSDSVGLFLDRARRVRPDFTPSDQDLAAIVRICRRLDGVPLGIELAAARLRSLSPPELADRLDESFQVLQSSSKTAVSRQRTLQATIDWSHDLLEESEAALFRRMSVFAGGFDLVGAEAVGAGDDLDSWEVLDLLDQLVDKSLVIVSHEGDSARFRLLEPIRQYGHERLAGEGETEAIHLSHARHYRSVVAANAPRLRGPDQVMANRALLAELDNIRVAFKTVLDHGLIDEYLAMGFDLTWFWAQSSMPVEGVGILLAGLDHADRASPTIAARAWWSTALLGVFLTNLRAVEWAERGSAVAAVTQDEGLVGWLELMEGVAIANLVSLERGHQLVASGRAKVEAHSTQPMWDADWDEMVTGFLLVFAGFGDGAEIREILTATIESALALGDRYMASLGMVGASYIRDPEQAGWVRETLRRGVEALRDLGFRHGLGHALIYYGESLQDEPDGNGDALIHEGSELLAEVGDLPCSLRASTELVEHRITDGDLSEAKQLLASATRRAEVLDTGFDMSLSQLAARLATAEGDDHAAEQFGAYTGDDREAALRHVRAWASASEPTHPGS